MKVLHLIDHLGLGGAQPYALDLVRAGVPEDSLLYALRSTPEDPTFSDANILIDSSPSKYSLGVLFRLRRLIQERQFDVIVSHLFRSHVVAWLLKKFFFPKIRLVFIEQGHIYEAGLLGVNFYRLASRDVDRIVAVSEGVKKKLQERLGLADEKVAVIHSGSDFKALEENAPTKQEVESLRQRLQVQEDEVLLGFLGRLEEQKGIDVLIKAFAKFLSLKPSAQCRLMLVGDGSLRTVLEDLVREYGLSERVSFLGYQQNSLLYLSCFDALILPSRFDPFPRALIEAQALGVPVVGSAVDGIPEMIESGETGLLVEPENIDSLVEALGKIVSSQELRELTSKNAKRSVLRFSLDEFVRRFDQLCRRIC